MSTQAVSRRPATEPDWYEGETGRDEIAALIRWLADTSQLTGVDDAIYVVEKPWKYSEEREQMVRERGRIA